MMPYGLFSLFLRLDACLLEAGPMTDTSTSSAQVTNVASNDIMEHLEEIETLITELSGRQ